MLRLLFKFLSYLDSWFLVLIVAVSKFDFTLEIFKCFLYLVWNMGSFFKIILHLSDELGSLFMFDIVIFISGNLYHQFNYTVTSTVVEILFLCQLETIFNILKISVWLFLNQSMNTRFFIITIFYIISCI